MSLKMSKLIKMIFMGERSQDAEMDSCLRRNDGKDAGMTDEAQE